MPTKTTVGNDARHAAMKYVMGCVWTAYPGPDPHHMANIGRLVDQVAEAIEKDDLQAVLVYGMRLLSMDEVAELERILGKS